MVQETKPGSPLEPIVNSKYLFLRLKTRSPLLRDPMTMIVTSGLMVSVAFCLSS